MKEKKKGPIQPAFEELSDKHKEFVLNYIENGGNITRAYSKAYSQEGIHLSDGVAAASGTRLLNNVKIKEILKKHYTDVWEEKQDKIGKVFDDLLKMVSVDISDIVEYENGEMKIKNFTDVKNTSIIKKITQKISETKDGRSVTESIEIVDKLKAIESMLKVLNMNQEKMEIKQTIEIIPATRPTDEEYPE